MKKFKIGLLSILIIALFGCQGDRKKSAGAVKDEKRVYLFNPPTPPPMLSDPVDRINYLVTKYWDNFDFADTAYIHLPDITEQAFVDYLQLLFNSPKESAITSLKQMLKKSEKDPKVFDYFLDLYERYLDNPNSPMRNEELYIPVLEHMIGSDRLSETEKFVPGYRLKMAMTNRMGSKANDLLITLESGQKIRLYDINADFIILFFNNPDCNACKEYMEEIRGSQLVTTLMEQKKIKIVAVYPDEDITAWRDYIPNIPKEWINGYDASLDIRNDEIYNLRAIPTLYLLDKDKIVLLKDAIFPMIESYILSLI